MISRFMAIYVEVLCDTTQYHLDTAQASTTSTKPRRLSAEGAQKPAQVPGCDCRAFLVEYNSVVVKRYGCCRCHKLVHHR